MLFCFHVFGFSSYFLQISNFRLWSDHRKRTHSHTEAIVCVQLKCCYFFFSIIIITQSTYQFEFFFSHDDKYCCIEITTIPFSNFRYDYLRFLFLFVNDNNIIKRKEKTPKKIIIEQKRFFLFFLHIRAVSIYFCRSIYVT